jgi:hypothetical protein
MNTMDVPKREIPPVPNNSQPTLSQLHAAQRAKVERIWISMS